MVFVHYAMMKLWKNIFTISIFVSTCRSENRTEKDDGYLQNCALSLMDLTITRETTDYLKLRLIVGNGPGHNHVYNISKATSLLADKEFRKDYRTVLYVYGFIDGPDLWTAPKIVEAYQTRGRHNIVILDCNGLLFLNYPRAARLTKYIGTRLGKVLSQMSKSGLNMATLDLVGHSLGSHIVGHTGKSYYKSTKKKLPRIIALDPAGPCFRNADVNDRLDKDDAEFVQVLHTNGGEFGLMVPVGDVDFYFNGGRKQPGPFGIFCFSLCSHNRVIDLWASSVLNLGKFLGVECLNLKEVNQRQCAKKNRKTAMMGPTANPKIKGIFYVPTTSNEPYFVGASMESYYNDPCYK